MRAVITAINADGSTPATSAQTGAVTAPAPVAPSNTALPTVSGTTIQGNALTTSNGSWSGSPTGYSYQWRQRNSSGNSCTSISGATGDCYRPESGDVGPGLLPQDVCIRLTGENYLAPTSPWGRPRGARRSPRARSTSFPDLVVAMLSPATRVNDLGPRRDVYLAAGVRELWLADPQSAAVTAVRPDGHEQTVGHGDRLIGPLPPGFAVDVARVFLT